MMPACFLRGLELPECPEFTSDLGCGTFSGLKNGFGGSSACGRNSAWQWIPSAAAWCPVVDGLLEDAWGLIYSEDPDFKLWRSAFDIYAAANSCANWPCWYLAKPQIISNLHITLGSNSSQASIFHDVSTVRVWSPRPSKKIFYQDIQHSLAEAKSLASFALLAKLSVSEARWKVACDAWTHEHQLESVTFHHTWQTQHDQRGDFANKRFWNPINWNSLGCPMIYARTSISTWLRLLHNLRPAFREKRCAKCVSFAYPCAGKNKSLSPWRHRFTMYILRKK